jgi:alcohol dehydrogenase class IV
VTVKGRIMDYKGRARDMLSAWKKDNYYFGIGVLDRAGDLAQRAGNTALLVGGRLGAGKWIEPILDKVKASLKNKNINILDIINGAQPNSPREDVYRIANQISKLKPQSIIAVGGGSTIDAVKASIVLSTLRADDIEGYYGTGIVAIKLKEEEKKLPPMVAVQTAASSGAHLTKYSNITDPAKAQKKLIIDEAITPGYAVFDYSAISNAPDSLKADGALDGLSHCMEVVCGATGRPFFEETMEIAEAGISLIVENLPKFLGSNAQNDAVENIGLGTDLGGYAIMVAGTNYAHLFSFSLVDKISHGRACAIANPYVLVFFAPAIQQQLRLFGKIFTRAGYMDESAEKYSGRDLGIAVAEAMMKFLRRFNFPTTFSEVGIGKEYKEKILKAAKIQQLWSKLEQSPVSLIKRGNSGDIDEKATKENIDQYMGPLVDAIITGDLDKIKNFER